LANSVRRGACEPANADGRADHRATEAQGEPGPNSPALAAQPGPVLARPVPRNPASAVRRCSDRRPAASEVAPVGPVPGPTEPSQVQLAQRVTDQIDPQGPLGEQAVAVLLDVHDVRSTSFSAAWASRHQHHVGQARRPAVQRLGQWRKQLVERGRRLAPLAGSTPLSSADSLSTTRQLLLSSARPLDSAFGSACATYSSRCVFGGRLFRSR